MGRRVSEGAEMGDDGFTEAIAGLVDRHPAIYYRMKLEDSHIPFHVVERDFFGDTFLEVFRQYNNALFDSVRLMIRLGMPSRPSEAALRR